MDIDKKLETIHSIVVRLKAVDEDGNGACPLCGNDKINYWSLVCGHFIRRRHGKFEYCFDNTDAICPACNKEDEELTGLKEPFRDYKVSTLGFEKVEQMERDIHKPFKWFKHEKNELLKLRRKEARELLNDKNFQVNIP